MKTFKRMYYTLRSSKNDIIGFFVWESVGMVGYYYRDNPKINFLFYSLIIAFAYFILMFLQGRNKDFCYIPLFRWSDRGEWIGSGRFEYLSSVKAFQITESHNGFIYSKTLTWTNYKASFEFRIETKSIGMILRANNLSNYLMFQIFEDRIQPHVRVNSVWFFPAELKFNSNLILGKWYKAEMRCEGTDVMIIIKDKNKFFFERLWPIPRGYAPFKIDPNNPNSETLNFPINSDYGAFGFRNDVTEVGLVRDLFIQKI